MSETRDTDFSVMKEVEIDIPEFDGLRVACISNAGLPAGKLRITYLPLSAFTEHALRDEEKR